MTSVSAVPAAIGSEMATDRLIEIVQSTHDARLDEHWPRDENGNAPDGLPLPSITHFYDQLTPTEIKDLYLGHVELYVGKTGGTDYGDVKTATGDGHLCKAVMPFALSIIFSDVPTPTEYRHPVTDQIMTAEAVNNRRIERYVGALKSALWEHANTGGAPSTMREAAVWQIDIEQDYATVGPLKVAQDNDKDTAPEGNGAIGTLAIRVHQWQLLPKHGVI